MGRIAEKNIRYRTKQQIVEDTAFVLACENLQFGTKYAVVDQVIWVWSEFEGKHRGCRYWSEKAVATGSKREGLVHEHVVPRKVIREKLFTLSKPSISSVKRILEKYCIGVVVTKEEDVHLRNLQLHSSMPEDWDRKDVWARYKKANIRVTPQPYPLIQRDV